MPFVDEAFPLLIHIGPSGAFGEDELQRMDAGYERYWKAGHRYALVTYFPPTSASNPRGRRLIADWANSPRVREMSGKLCIASATIVVGALARCTMTALLWIWSPPMPHLVAAKPEEGVDYCLDALDKSLLPRSESRAEMRRIALRALRTEEALAELV